MAKNEIQNLLDTFADGSGFGDPDARRNAEVRLQLLLAREQQRTAFKLNWLTFLLASLANYVSRYNLACGLIGEASVFLWLLVMGVNIQRWEEQASAEARA